MQHYLITRFNLPVFELPAGHVKPLLMNDQWLQHRFDLFKRYTLPSVLNQSNQNFKWLILFDKHTPMTYSQTIQEICSLRSGTIPLYLTNFEELLSAVQHFISHQVEGQYEKIITSRLDNDDVIHRDYIQDIQTIAVSKLEDTIIDLRAGYQLNLISTPPLLRMYTNSFNQFISLVESGKNIQTVLKNKHGQWRNFPSIHVEQNNPKWIEMVHTSNWINAEKTEMALTTQIRWADFGIWQAPDIQNVRTTLLHNFGIKIKKILHRLLNKIG